MFGSVGASDRDALAVGKGRPSVLDSEPAGKGDVDRVSVRQPVRLRRGLGRRTSESVRPEILGLTARLQTRFKARLKVETSKRERNKEFT